MDNRQTEIANCQTNYVWFAILNGKVEGLVFGLSFQNNNLTSKLLKGHL